MLEEKRTKPQGISAQNKNSHLLSRGGYRKLEEKILMRKKRFRPPSFEGDCLKPPSPPSRHLAPTLLKSYEKNLKKL